MNKKYYRYYVLSMFLLLTIIMTTLCASGLWAQETPVDWFKQGGEAVRRAEALDAIEGRAKNVILFVGDGMGMTTVTAARILEGQQRGQTGEENLLSFEKFPYTALSKTYAVNQQIPDSASTMTAIITGVKTNAFMVSVSSSAQTNDCASIKGNELTTLLERAEQAGLSTGVVTNTRLTHATPAAAYAHAAHRQWESDQDLPKDARNRGCKDIARQLIEFPYGNGLEVAMGGGRTNFLPKDDQDPEDSEKSGRRRDRRDLTKEWTAQHPDSAYVWNSKQLQGTDHAKVGHLLGLFSDSHMAYEHDRPKDKAGEPSLSEMTASAIAILAKNKRGFVLVVEGGMIDIAHHSGNAYRALTEAIEMSKAVQVAVEKTKPEETLIIVTADHSQPLVMAGYTTRGNPILGKVVENDYCTGKCKDSFSKDATGLPYTTLNYAIGPGYTADSDEHKEVTKKFKSTQYKGIKAGRPDLTHVDTTAPNYLQETVVPLAAVSHAGEDVPIYATGPGAHLVHGVMEQNVIYHVMEHALGLSN
ncbi:MAG TPA: alkaline phosphatase [Thermodesulfovibrionia bacterium]|nr:alkaline phosphatase [Thermodesulfovibrionia bacterium]